MALYSEFQYGDGVLYGATSLALKFTADAEISYGGARHGGINLVWDITGLTDSIGAKAIMIVARQMTPATVPEEGSVVHLDWKADAVPSGTLSYYTQAGQWTYFSLFVMGQDRRWRWVSFRLALPVSDWDYGQILPRMLPGAMTSDDQNIASGPTAGNLLLELLREFGFVLDEIKTSAEALIPFWQSHNIVPQAAFAIAKILDVPYIAELGPEAYRRLLSIKSDDSGLDTIGRKVAAVTGWRSRTRPAINNMLNVNDSSGEIRVGAWYPPNSASAVATVVYASITSGVAELHFDSNPSSIGVGDTVLVTGLSQYFNGTFTVTAVGTTSGGKYYIRYSAPVVSGSSVVSISTEQTTVGLVSKITGTVSRVLYTDPSTVPTKITENDLKQEAFLRFPTGTWICGEFATGGLPRHLINIQPWPTVAAGFFLKVNAGTSVSVSLSLDTYSSSDDNTATNVPLISLTGLSASSNGTWHWYDTSGVLPLNTDALASPKIVITGTGAQVDLDVITIGPAPRGYRPVPRLEAELLGNRIYDNPDMAYNASINYDEALVRLVALNTPEHSSAIVNWGNDTAPEVISWDSLSGHTNDYTKNILQQDFATFFITANDVNDPLIAASTSITLGQEFN